MALQILGGGGLLAEVDGTTYRALRRVMRPPHYGNGGIYHLSEKTGTIAAGLAAGSSSASHLFAFRWSSSTLIAVVLALRWRFQLLNAFTAGSLASRYGFEAYVVRSYTASHSGGTGLPLTDPQFKTRRNMQPTAAADIRLATNGGLTNGTETFDAHPFTAALGYPQEINPNTGTEAQRMNTMNGDWRPRVAFGEHPIVLAANEGIVVRNGPRAWPAAGAGIVQFDFKWAELPAY